MLEVTDLHAFYGNISALRGTTLRIEQGSIVALLGANGAGKTTLVRTISGLHPTSRGQILFEGKRIDRVEPDVIVRRGVVHVPQGRQLFTDMTVSENLDMGAYLRNDRSGVKADLESVFTMFPRLKERRAQKASTLSGGEQQILAIGRALMSKPKLLILDEPSIGLAPQIVEQVFELIKQTSSANMAILVAEQNAVEALAIADIGYVLLNGRIAISGTAQELRANQDVRRLYLGDVLDESHLATT